MELMQSLGFAEAYNMLGGITGWEEAGYPVVAPITPITTTSTTPTTPTGIVITTTMGQAIFVIWDLHTEPVQPASDAYFSIIFDVINIGSGNGTYKADVLITEVTGENRMEIGTLTKSVAVAAGESKVVSIDEVHLPEADYELAIGDLTHFFKCY